MAMAIHVLRLEAEPYRQRQAARQGLVAIERLTEHGCNEHGTFYVISSDFGDRMTTQHLD